MVTINKKSLKILSELCDNGHILGGSVSLHLQGFDLNRPFKDFDLIYTKKIDNKYPYKDYITDKRSPQPSGGGDFFSFINIEGIDFEILKRYVSSSEIKNIKHKGFKLKIQTAYSICQIKHEYAMKGYIKHAKDLYKIYRQQLKYKQFRDNQK